MCMSWNDDWKNNYSNHFSSIQFKSVIVHLEKATQPKKKQTKNHNIKRVHKMMAVHLKGGLHLNQNWACFVRFFFYLFCFVLFLFVCLCVCLFVCFVLFVCLFVCLFVSVCFVLFCFVLFFVFWFFGFCFWFFLVLFCFVLFCFFGLVWFGLVLFCFVLFCFVLFVLFCFVFLTMLVLKNNIILPTGASCLRFLKTGPFVYFGDSMKLPLCQDSISGPVQLVLKSCLECIQQRNIRS